MNARRITPGAVIAALVITLTALAATHAPATCKSTLDATCEVAP